MEQTKHFKKGKEKIACLQQANETRIKKGSKG
jgi:hypothetical protein